MKAARLEEDGLGPRPGGAVAREILRKQKIESVSFLIALHLLLRPDL
jgi:hypothetical protein